MQPGASSLPRGNPGEPVEAPETVVDAVPGEDREPDPADAAPQRDIPVDRVHVSSGRIRQPSRPDRQVNPLQRGVARCRTVYVDADHSGCRRVSRLRRASRSRPSEQWTDGRSVRRPEQPGFARTAIRMTADGRGGQAPAPTRGPMSASGYCGRLFTSASHLASRRLRSADDPYLAKS